MNRFYGVICLSLCSVLVCNAMDNEEVVLIAGEGALAAASKFLDHAADRDRTMYQGAYEALVKQKQVDIRWPSYQDSLGVNGMDLSRQRLTTLGCFVLPTYISANSITELNVSHNQLTDLRFQNLIENLPSLEKLIAAHNDISYISVIRTRHAFLKFLDLSHNKLTDFDLTDLMRVFPWLKTIDVSHNQIGFVRIKKGDDACVPEVDISEVTVKLGNNEIQKSEIPYIKDNYMEAIKNRFTIVQTGWAGLMGWSCGVVGLFIFPAHGFLLSVPTGLASFLYFGRQNAKKLDELAKCEHLQFGEQQIIERQIIVQKL